MTQLIKIDKNQLTIREKNITKSLPASYREMVELRQEAPISKINDLALTDWCLQIITVAFTESSPNGQIDSDILSFQAGQLKNELTGKYTQLTISELKTAFKRGIRGEAGQYFGMCARTYNQFIKWFYHLPERQEGWMKYLNLLNADSDQTGKDIPVNPEGQKEVIKILKNTLAEMKENQELRRINLKKPRERDEREKYIQKCFSDFDNLADKNPSKDEKGRKIPGRFTDIEVNGELKAVDVTEYTREKLKEYDTLNPLPANKI